MFGFEPLPPLHHSNTPSPQYSTTPSLHHSIPLAPLPGHQSSGLSSLGRARSDAPRRVFFPYQRLGQSPARELRASTVLLLRSPCWAARTTLAGHGSGQRL